MAAKPIVPADFANPDRIYRRRMHEYHELLLVRNANCSDKEREARKKLYAMFQASLTKKRFLEAMGDGSQTAG